MDKPIPEAVVTDKLIADLLSAALIFAENEEHLDHARQRAKTILLETLTAAQQQGQAVAWRPMATAPRDGTMVRLLVEFTDHATEDAETAPTIGACDDDNVPEDERVGWQFAGWCWSHDHFTEGKGTPVGWLPMLDTAPPPSVPVRMEGLVSALRSMR